MAVAAIMAFNLVCTGVLSSNSYHRGKKVEPYASTYRIDLASSRYCDGECQAPRPLAAVYPTQLQLQNDKKETATEKSVFANFVDRQTGAHTITAISETPGDPTTILLMKWEGRCERAAFTGFPKFDTKF